MQIFDWTRSSSKQREMQQIIDQPVQYMFAFNYQYTPIPKDSRPKKPKKETAIVNFLANGNIKVYPVAKDMIVFRLENMGDVFDGYANARTHYINLQKYARDFYQKVNLEIPKQMIIEEMTISNSNQLSEQVSKKFVWKAQGDDSD